MTSTEAEPKQTGNNFGNQLTRRTISGRELTRTPPHVLKNAPEMSVEKMIDELL